MSKTLLMVLGVLLIWIVIVKQFRFSGNESNKQEQKHTTDKIDSVGVPAKPRTYTM